MICLGFFYRNLNRHSASLQLNRAADKAYRVFGAFFREKFSHLPGLNTNFIGHDLIHRNSKLLDLRMEVNPCKIQVRRPK